MLNKRVEEYLNKQINEEMFSSYLYLSMSAHFEAVGLKGFANWMRVQAKEEDFHANKIYDYINERSGRVVLKAIDEPKVEWENTLEAIQDTLNHENKITNLINELVNISMEEKDHATVNFLQWFVSEQVEEEANAQELFDQLRFIEDNKSALYMLDKELKARVFVVPATAVK